MNSTSRKHFFILSISVIGIFIMGSAFASNSIISVAKNERNQIVLSNDTTVYFKVEKKPTFPDGNAKAFEFIKQNLKCPDELVKNGFVATVTVQFIVEKNGVISNVKALEGVGWGCEAEAVRVIRLMPNWIPGEQDGQPVRCYVSFPILFQPNK